MDFYKICTREIERGPKKGEFEVYPDFVVGRSKDLMVRGRSFYAIWDEAAGLWSTDEYDVQRLIDEELRAYAEVKKIENIRFMKSFKSNGWTDFRKFMHHISDNSHQLDENLTFANTEVKKSDYVSRRLPYSMESGDFSAWDELVGTLYKPEEREKIEWSIGSIISGDSKKNQKFLVLYGPPGAGKGTIINVASDLFEGYIKTFDARALGSAGNQFAAAAFAENPLVAIQHDGDLSKIEDNTTLNSIVSHEIMRVNEKYKPAYDARFLAFLIMGTNKPVKITDAQSGIIRRLIDVHPSGVRFAPTHYHELMSRIKFELGAIAHHCLEVYRTMGKNYYNSYQPLEMMFQTDIFFNYIEANFDIFKEQNGVSLRQAYALYKQFCDETGIERPLPQYKVRSELQNYFEEFKDRAEVDGVMVRSYFSGFNANKFKAPKDDNIKAFSLVMEEKFSLFDLEYSHMAAQYANEHGTPKQRWSEIKTSLGEIDTSELHYVQVPEQHIVIDFDLVGEDGQKSLERNLSEASTWPPTYGELSKSGKAVHLHYNYDGDVGELSSVYGDGIEVKRFVGNSSLRRKLTRCNNVPVATINSGLPLKEKKSVLDSQTIQSEKGLRDLIERNLRKEIHPGTKPSIDFIKKILDDAYDAGMKFDVIDLRPRIVAFANNSSNQPLLALKTVQQMRFQGGMEGESPTILADEVPGPIDDRLVFYDVEVYSNLFVICWKYQGSETVVRMINPTPQEVEKLFRLKLVGFNNRRYDNHIIYGRYMGFDNDQLYRLSQKIISGNVGSMFGEAYNLSWTDIYDYSSKKQGLKKFGIELGLHHVEMDIPWEEPVPDDKISKVVEYCVNDVLLTEATHEARKQDYIARQILAELSGLTTNDTTQKHAARIIFGEDRNPQREFVYTDLAKEFPSYVFDHGKSSYRDEEVGEGGLVRAKPGIYEDVALLDVASMHPASIRQLNAFGAYTPRFVALMDARLAIKRAIKTGDYSEAKKAFNGRLEKFLGDATQAAGLSDALKIAINIVYGLTSAKFDNPFRDPRNVDNIVAKRGALFMIDLKHFVEDEGFIAAHIKTDSIKIPNATQEIIEKVQNFAKKYGYDMEHEATYSKLALVNDAVYIAKKDECITNCWTAVGAQFQHPYVFKTLFGANDDITFEDLCETKQVSKGAMYLDFDSLKPMHQTDIPMGLHFVGRTGRFVPVKEGFGGGILYRINEGKSYAVAGTKNYLWAESETASTLPKEAIDMDYFERLLDEARNTISKFGDFDKFVD